MPLVAGGSDEEDNLALACRSCNIYKAAFREGVDPQTEHVAPLFNPREQRWKEHFDVNEETGTIAGMTSVGRATVVRLRMNSAAQITARVQWIRVGLY